MKKSYLLLCVTYMVFFLNFNFLYAKSPHEEPPQELYGRLNQRYRFVESPLLKNDIFQINNSKIENFSPYVNLSITSKNKFQFDKYISFFQPLVINNSSILFLNLGLNQLNIKSNYSIGGGYRKLLSESSLFGTYIFFDQQESYYKNTFKRITIGGEFFISGIETRLNLYFPVGKQRYKSYITTDRVYSNNGIQDSQSGLLERNLSGADISVGGRLPFFPNLNVNLLYKRFYNSQNKHNLSLQALLEINKNIFLKGSVGLVKKTGNYIGIHFSLPLGGRRRNSRRFLTQMVRRQERIITETIQVQETKTISTYSENTCFFKENDIDENKFKQNKSYAKQQWRKLHPDKNSSSSTKKFTQITQLYKQFHKSKNQKSQKIIHKLKYQEFEEHQQIEVKTTPPLKYREYQKFEEIKREMSNEESDIQLSESASIGKADFQHEFEHLLEKNVQPQIKEKLQVKDENKENINNLNYKQIKQQEKVELNVVKVTSDESLSQMSWFFENNFESEEELNQDEQQVEIQSQNTIEDFNYSQMSFDDNVDWDNVEFSSQPDNQEMELNDSQEERKKERDFILEHGLLKLDKIYDKAAKKRLAVKKKNFIQNLQEFAKKKQNIIVNIAVQDEPQKIQSYNLNLKNNFKGSIVARINFDAAGIKQNDQNIKSYEKQISQIQQNNQKNQQTIELLHEHKEEIVVQIEQAREEQSYIKERTSACVDMLKDYVKNNKTLKKLINSFSTMKNKRQELIDLFNDEKNLSQKNLNKIDEIENKLKAENEAIENQKNQINKLTKINAMLDAKIQNTQQAVLNLKNNQKDRLSTSWLQNNLKEINNNIKNKQVEITRNKIRINNFYQQKNKSILEKNHFENDKKNQQALLKSIIDNKIDIVNEFKKPFQEKAFKKCFVEIYSFYKGKSAQPFTNSTVGLYKGILELVEENLNRYHALKELKEPLIKLTSDGQEEVELKYKDIGVVTSFCLSKIKEMQNQWQVQK